MVDEERGRGKDRRTSSGMNNNKTHECSSHAPMTAPAPSPPRSDLMPYVWSAGGRSTEGIFGLPTCRVIKIWRGERGDRVGQRKFARRIMIQVGVGKNPPIGSACRFGSAAMDKRWSPLPSSTPPLLQQTWPLPSSPPLFWQRKAREPAKKESRRQRHKWDIRLQPLSNVADLLD